MKLDLIPWAFSFVVAIALAWVRGEYLDLQIEYAVYKGRVVQQAEDLMAAARAQENEYRNNLDAVKEDYEKRLSEINAVALRNYRRMRDDAATRERISLSLAPGSVKVDAGTATERLVAAQPAGGIDDAVIGACAEDALKLSAWQDWAKRNGVPVEE